MELTFDMIDSDGTRENGFKQKGRFRLNVKKKILYSECGEAEKLWMPHPRRHSEPD